MNHYHLLLAQTDKNIKMISSASKYLSYNIFYVLGIQAKEVIMCRFLADLLNPEGRHGCGIRFLKSFLRDALNIQMSDFLLTHTEVIKEYELEDNRRIDLVIQNAEYLIPIEVKIYADEQEGQCFEYYKKAKNAKLIYLTRFGNLPSEYSRMEKGGSACLTPAQIQCISWNREIYQWLDGETASLEDPLKMEVLQYMDAIHEIADEREKIVTDKVIEALYESPEFFEAGIEIEKTMKLAKVRLLRLIFDEFKYQLESLMGKYGLELERQTGYHSYENAFHDKYYDCYSTYPGLNYIVKKAHFRQKNLQMWFRIEIEHNLFAGFCLFDTEAETKDSYSKGCQVEKITDVWVVEASRYLKKEIILPEDWWFAWCYPNGRYHTPDEQIPDFKQMNPRAVSLVDETKRKAYVKEAVEVFEKELLSCLL